jgi:hypothetical protein
MNNPQRNDLKKIFEGCFLYGRAEAIRRTTYFKAMLNA